MNFALKICIYHAKTKILHKPLLKKQYFHNNLLKIHIKLHEIANFLEELQSKQALWKNVTESFIRKLKNIRIFGRKLNIFIRKLAYFD